MKKRLRELLKPIIIYAEIEKEGIVLEEQITLTLSESQLRFVRIALMESIHSAGKKALRSTALEGQQMTARMREVQLEKTLEEVTRQYLGEFA